MDVFLGHSEPTPETPVRDATPEMPNVPPVPETPPAEATPPDANAPIIKPEKLTIHLTKEVSDQLIDAVARRKKARKKDDPAVSKFGIIEEALLAWFDQQDDMPA